MAKKPRDLEAVVGRYRGPNEEVLVLNFHHRRTGAYDVSVYRQKKELEIVISGHRFEAKFEKLDGFEDEYQGNVFNSFSIDDQTFNEFKIGSKAFKNGIIGIRKSAEGRQLQFEVKEFRIADYNYLKTLDIPSDMWKGYSPTAAKFYSGSSVLKFLPGAKMEFQKKNKKGLITETILFRREENYIRGELFGSKDYEAAEYIRSYDKCFDEALFKETLDDPDPTNIDILCAAAAVAEENFKEEESSFKGFIKASDVYRHTKEKKEVIIEEKEKNQGEYEDQEEDDGDN